MKYRCINAFTFNDRMYPGGLEVDGDDEILASHGAHFAQVAEPPARSVETATAGPGEARNLTPPQKAPARKAPAKKAAPKAAPAESEKKPDESDTADVKDNNVGDQGGDDA
ncbi:hypothetical protein [Nocardia sp. Marseille-Q1738]